MAYYRKLRTGDIEDLAPRLRDVDKKEIFLMTGEGPLEGLRNSCLLSEAECNSIIHEDKVIGIFGVVDAGNGLGVPWLLGSPEVPQIAKELNKGAKEWVEKIQSRFPVLANYVLEENSVSIRWLKRLGFVMVQRVPIGKHGEDFIEFARVNHV